MVFDDKNARFIMSMTCDPSAMYVKCLMQRLKKLFSNYWN